MTWFNRLCRQTGLTIHQIVKPAQSPQKREVNRSVDQTQVSDTLTLRRTTVDEIEIRPDDNRR